MELSSYERLIKIIFKTLSDTDDVVKLPMKTGDILLTYRIKDELIDDEDCGDVFKVLQNGVYRRYEKQSNDKNTYVWLHFCNLEVKEMKSSFKNEFEGVSEKELSEIIIFLAYQNHIKNKKPFQK